MTKDQQESPLAKRRARRTHTVSIEEPSWGERLAAKRGRIFRLALVVTGVVTVIALGMTWQSSVDPDTTLAAGTGQVEQAQVEPSAAEGATEAAAESSPSPTKPMTLPELWRTRIADLDEKRIRAFVTRDREALQSVNVANSPAQSHDEELLASLTSRELKPVAHKTTIHSAKPISGDNESALVEVVDSRSEYVVTTDSMNRTIKRFKANERAKWRVSLQNVAGSWLVYSVVAA